MSSQLTDEALLRDLSAEDEKIRLAAVVSLTGRREIALSERALEALVGCLGAASRLLQRRAGEALAATAASDWRAVEAVRRALSSSEARTRWGAAYALGLIGDALDLDALKNLLEALASPDGDVRWAAAELVVTLGRKHPAAVRVALLSLVRSGAPIARRMALYCLRDMMAADMTLADDDVLRVAEESARASDPLLRLAALSLLSRLPGERALIAVLGRLDSDPNPGVRRSAAVALGRLGSRSHRVLEALKRAAGEPGDPFLRRSAGTALRRLGA